MEGHTWNSRRYRRQGQSPHLALPRECFWWFLSLYARIPSIGSLQCELLFQRFAWISLHLSSS